jgi:exopolysaccharide biosynthesis polyprenyl glycosylphosphotransferase
MNVLTVAVPQNRQSRRPARLRLPARRSLEPFVVPMPTTGNHWANRYRKRLAFSDLVVVLAAVALANFVRYLVVGPENLLSSSAVRFAIISMLVVAVWGVALALFRTRDRLITGVGFAEYQRVLNATSTVLGLLAIIFVAADSDAARWFVTLAFPVGVLALLLSRWLWRQWLIRERAAGRFLWNVVVVGRRGDVEDVVRQIKRNPGAAYAVVGAVVEDGDLITSDGVLKGLGVMTGLDKVADYASRVGADSIVVAGQPRESSGFVHDLAWRLEGRNVELILATSLANVAGPRVHFRPVDGLPLLHVEIPEFEGGKHALKRVLDVAVSGLALLVLSPFFLVLSVLIRLDSSGPAFFTQERVGRGGQTFRMIKFRSMVQDAPKMLADLLEKNEGNGVLFKMKHDPRVTRLGRVLRKYSLDEFPQFVNVFLGHMSLVGPRPPLMREVQEYEGHVRRRLYIKPGLTGMWQVGGRSELSWEDSVRLDLYYVENWSIMGDLIIMWRTFKVIANPVGAY